MINTSPFTIDIPQADVDDLRARISQARLPNVVDEETEEAGVSIAWLRRLLAYWIDEYDWAATQAKINNFHQFTALVGTERIHFVHQTSPESDRLPVLLLHGWPDSFLRFHAVITPVADAGHPVVVPSLPGYAFSDQPAGPLTLDYAAEQLHQLMIGLGYQRYAVHGGDWGAGIADRMAALQPESVAALHLTDVPFSRLFEVDRSQASEAEQAYFKAADAWMARETTYLTVQTGLPTALSAGVGDSPVGLAAWFGGRMRYWYAAEPVTDDLLTNLSLYWFTNTARSSFRLYAEGFGGDWGDDAGEDWSGAGDWGAADASAAAADDAQAAGDWSGGEGAGDWGGPSSVPTGIALFPEDFAVPPREYAARLYDLRRFTVMPRGGHFGALEEPDLFAEDLLGFLTDLS